MVNSDKKIITNLSRLDKHHSSDELSLPESMDRFAVLRLIDKIHKRIGLNASQVKLYEFFIAHTSDIDWEAGNICICFWSVEGIAEELDMSIRQIQTNTDSLVRAGLISLRLSGNYRRSGHRNKETGKLVWASGADLKPVLERMEEFQLIADTAKEDKNKKQILNKKIGSLRREVRSLITLHCPELLEQFVHVLDMRSRLTWAYDRLESVEVTI